MNTNDKMQPTSSASGAEQLSVITLDDISELIAAAQCLRDQPNMECQARSKIVAEITQRLHKAKAIVPPVVQAPIGYIRATSLSHLQAGNDSSIYPDASVGSVYANREALPVYLQPVAAPIVANVPSIENSYFSASTGKLTRVDIIADGNLVTLHVAAPSPTEQAIDVRNAALGSESGVIHPVQPLYADGHGTTRFKRNKIVCHLLDCGPFDMNSLACGDFSDEDHEQFAQLIGYSLSGFSELSYVSDATYDRAAAQLSATPADKGNAPVEAKS